MRSPRLRALFVCLLLLYTAACFEKCPGGGGGNETTVAPATTAPPSNREKLVIGRVPSGNLVDIREKMDHIRSLLARSLGIDVDIRFAKDYADFTERMERHEYDLAFCAPFQYIAAHEKSGYSAALRPVRHGADTYVGIIITARPEITDLAHLKGKKVAFVDRSSTSGFLFPLGLLSGAGVTLKNITYQFLGGHDNVVLNVQLKTYDAGACFEGAVEQYGKQGADQTRVIARTEPIYSEPIAVSPDFLAKRAELAKKVIDFMLHMHESPEGLNALKAYDKHVSRLVEAADKDYASVRKYRDQLPASVIEGSGL